VKKVLIDAGVHVPIRVIGGGIDHVLRETPSAYPGPLGRGFRFLHVSSAFPRKGIDVLLAAYVQAFSDAADVTLVLKTFPNLHNETAEQVRALRDGNRRAPDVVLIDGDLPAGQLADLYRQCHAFVAPTRGEGFGLPMAEAMLLGLPVVTTAFGGHRDFCRDDVCWPVDFTFARSRSHMGLFNSVWVEPDIDDLARAMRAVVDAPATLRSQKTRRAAGVVAEECTWARSAATLRAHVAALDEVRPLAREPIRLGWATSWNSRCGIARYSKFLLDHLPDDAFRTTILASRVDPVLGPDGPDVRRCWGDAMHQPDLTDLKAVVADEALDAVVLQFNFGFFATDFLGDLVQHLADRNVRTVVVFHSTRDGANDSLRRIRPALARADRLLVHSIADLNRLKTFGLVDNVTLFPQGVVDHRPASAPDEARRRLALGTDGPVVASYGFLLPHKGVEQLLEAFPQVLRAHPQARLLLVNATYPNPDSEALWERCVAAIDRLGLIDRVHLVTEFLEDEESLCLLECADLVVYPYQGSDESSSAAVRFGLASGRPVACTPAPIFDDVSDVVHFLPGPRPAQLAQGILELLGAPERLAACATRQREWLTSHAWPVIARRLGGMLRALTNDDDRRATSSRPEESDVHDTRRHNQFG
jgi:glycosyltransferase involved in cell wall biosynthesis